MDYFLILVLFIIGVAFHVMEEIKKLRKQFPQLTPGSVFKTFFAEEWDSLLVSTLLLVVTEIALLIIHYNKVQLPGWIDHFGKYALAIALGYCGQRIAYKYLATAELVLEKKADQVNNIIP